MLLRDPVHGLISFGALSSGPNRRRVDRAGRLVVQLLDTREVQRLRRIRALGLASLVFPGGEHSRFAHAVGSAHVMQRYLEHVTGLSGELAAEERIDSEMAAIALAAALLHDLGHGPLSHAFEVLLPDGDRHEDWTSRIVLDPGTEVNACLRAFSHDAPALVEALIRGRNRIPHLARAVSGTFDVDRCDYLMRDSHMTGVRYGLLDLDWLLASLRLFIPDSGEKAILAVDGGKGLTAVEGFFLARLYMYRQVYHHKAVRAADLMLQALFARLVELGPPPGTPAPLATLLRGEVLSTSAFLELDDPVLEVALAHYSTSGDPILAELATALRNRRLFKTLDLDPGADSEAAEARLKEVLSATGPALARYGRIDRVEVKAYVEDRSLVVLGNGGRVQPLLEASPLLRGLSRESFVHNRAVFPVQMRDAVVAAMAPFT